MVIKLKPVSNANAEHIEVLPTPGGPYTNIPFGGLIPNIIKSSGHWIGYITEAFKELIASSKPYKSVNFISLFFLKKKIIINYV